MASVADKVDMSLDDLIKSKPKPGKGKKAIRGGRGAGKMKKVSPADSTLKKVSKGGVGKSLGSSKKANPKSKGKAILTKTVTNKKIKSENIKGLFSGNFADRGGKGLVTGVRIEIANLDFGVSDLDIKQIFEDIGPVKRSGINYDKNGRSLGTGYVLFKEKKSAIDAIKKFNGERLDGRPMQITLGASTMPASIMSGKTMAYTDGKQVVEVTRGLASALRSTSSAPGGHGRGGRGRGRRGPPRRYVDNLKKDSDTYMKE